MTYIAKSKIYDPESQSNNNHELIAGELSNFMPGLHI